MANNRSNGIVSRLAKKRLHGMPQKPPRVRWVLFNHNKLSPSDKKRIAENAERARCIEV
jgi:hypothetical protein